MRNAHHLEGYTTSTLAQMWVQDPGRNANHNRLMVTKSCPGRGIVTREAAHTPGAPASLAWGNGSQSANHTPFLTVRSKIPSVARRADSGTIGKRSLRSPVTFDQS